MTNAVNPRFAVSNNKATTTPPKIALLIGTRQLGTATYMSVKAVADNNVGSRDNKRPLPTTSVAVEINGSEAI